MTVMVPPLEELREMSEPQLLKLRTKIAADMANIQHQIRYGPEREDETWIFRAGSAAHVREMGLSMIKNVLAERVTHRPVQLASWMLTLLNLAHAAEGILETYDFDDDEPEWVLLDKCVQNFRDFKTTIEGE
jgi:hypothetical protein